VTVDDAGRRLHVDVTLTRPTVFLNLIGVDHAVAHGHATANLTLGIRDVIP
jgi:hypothetical protein